MRQILLSIAILLLLVGCDQGDTKTVNIFDPYHKMTSNSLSSDNKIRKSREDRAAERDRAIELAKLKSEENLKLAQIEAKTKEKVKQIEAEATKLKVMSEKEVNLENQKIQKAIAFLREKTTLDTKDRDVYINQITIIAAISMLILILLVYYIIQHKKRALELKIQEEKLKHEAYMQASAHQHEKITRVLEIIADKDTDEYIKSELITIIKEQPQEQPLISYTPDESNEIGEETKDDDSIDIEEAPSIDVNSSDDTKESDDSSRDAKSGSDETR
ncbi:hypothetical protein MNB_SV-6-567 [hydrothermal vent metagenome]|uniref:Uncharacterized protein n=1 Tax=hydrothermal vent metagenome TaxID=652676 RepID=A0A1W1CBL6_9ZZZZ